MSLVKHIHDLVKLLAGKNIAGAYRPEKVDLALTNASFQLFGDLIVEGEKNNVFSTLLDPFKAVEISESETGNFVIPDDFYIDRAIFTENGYNVEKVLDIHWASRSKSLIGAPTEKTAIYKKESLPKSDGGRGINYELTFEVLPKSLIKIHIHFYKIPSTPKLGFDIDENDKYVYNAEKTDEVEWGFDASPNLIAYTARNLGINLREDQLVQYSELLNQNKDHGRN